MVPINVNIDDFFAPDPEKLQAATQQDPYHYLVVDGGGLVVTAWSVHRNLEHAHDRIRGATYVFVAALASLSRLVADDAKVIVCWDGRDNRAFRRGRHPWYKHGRGTVVNRVEVRKVIDQLSKLIKAMGIGEIIKDGHEADDLVATTAKKIADAGHRALIFSDDKDYLQLVNEQIHLCRRSMNGILLTPDQAALLGVDTGPRYLSMKALMGDTGDNIKGLAGIGEAKARKLVDMNPEIVTKCHEIGEEFDWAWLTDKNLRNAIIRAGRKLVFPTKMEDAEFATKIASQRGLNKPTDDGGFDITDEDCLKAAAVEIGRTFPLVQMVVDIKHDEVRFPKPNLEAIPGILVELDLDKEHDLYSSLYALSRMRNPHADPAWRPAVRAGDAIRREDPTVDPLDRF